MDNRTDPQYKLRMPPELRDKLKKAAKENHRTMNAEIVARLQESFESLNSSDFVQIRRSELSPTLDKESVTVQELAAVVRLFKQSAMLVGESQEDEGDDDDDDVGSE